MLAQHFVYAELWVGRDQDSTDYFNSLNIGNELPQYAIVDAQGKLTLHYARPANVASITPEGFASYLQDGLKKAAP